MGANSKQALGLVLFLAGWTVIAAGMAGGGMFLILIGLVVLAAGFAVLLKAKPLEHIES